LPSRGGSAVDAALPAGDQRESFASQEYFIHPCSISIRGSASASAHRDNQCRDADATQFVVTPHTVTGIFLHANGGLTMTNGLVHFMHGKVSGPGSRSARVSAPA